ncbi:MAG TPA: hypothetical protein VFU15_13405, partial [Bacteroidia bacterium]|nr:hypothetical protein [Bacteroidia bacterium]
MAKRAAPKKVSARRKAVVFSVPEIRGRGWFFTNDFRIQGLVIVIAGLLFYWNSWNNQYALDDDIIMNENMYVQKGFSGIPEILSNDAYKSYYQSMGVEQQLNGGRYRPLSIVSFAIEQQIFGDCYGDRYSDVRDSLLDLQKKGITDAPYMNRLINERNALDTKIKDSNLKIAPVRHIFQILWFVLSMVVLLYFLREFIFRTNTDVAFLAVLLFTIHPIHTEVVAN